MNVPVKPESVIQSFKEFLEGKLGITLKEVN
jgi:hypothetical protein